MLHDQSMTYDRAFYDRITEQAYRSAQKYAGVLAPILQPGSVIDVGCGHGAWLLAFSELGAETVVGLDGPWNSQADMIDQRIVFRAVDLDRPKSIETDRFDVTVCLEVAEHLPATVADDLVKLLTDLSDIVVFSAAFYGQTGRNHINEQPHTYWAEKFLAHGYRPFDIFRARFWGDSDVAVWYRQNLFVYAKEGRNPYNLLVNKGYRPVENIAFMDCVHPTIYDNALYYRARYRPEPQGVRAHWGALKRIVAGLLHAVPPAVRSRLLK
jgi:SAM-dependent methyltransferase